MISSRTSLHVSSALLLALLFGVYLPGLGQRSSVSRYRGLEILATIKNDIRDEYYDPQFHGMDLDARFDAAAEKIKNAESTGQIHAIVAQVLSELEDSHTYFVPPSWFMKVDYGFNMHHIGQGCYVISLDPNSDAAKKGLMVGDLITAIDGFTPSRENLRKIKYSYFILQPRDGMTLEVRNQKGETRSLRLTMKLIAGDELERENKKLEPTFKPRYYEVDGKILVCKMPHFNFGDGEIETMMKKVTGRQALVIDLRGNPGGRVSALHQFAGYFFSQDITIGERKSRKEREVLTAKSQGKKVFTGELVVIIDSQSSSAAEAFARTVQLQKRGTVIGDRSAGAVMVSQRRMHKFKRPPSDDWSFRYFGVSITIEDLIMSDERSLEHVGVTPDVTVLPTSSDLAERWDPVLAHAVKLAGGHLDAAQAGGAFQSP